MLENITIWIGGILITIIGFFLKKTINDVEKVKEIAYSTKSKVDIIETDYKNKYDNLIDKFDDLNDTMKLLTQEIKELNKRIK